MNIHFDNLQKDKEEINTKMTDISTKLSMAVDQAAGNSFKIEDMEELSSTVHEDVQFLKNFVLCQDRQIQHLQDKALQMSTKLIENNIVIAGVDGDHAGEQCTQTVLEFLHSKMKIELYDVDIISAFCQGQKKGTNPRNLLVKCSPAMRRKIFQYVGNLKGLKNEQDRYYFVNQQLSEALAAEQRQFRIQIRKIKEKNESFPPKEQVSVSIKQHQLFVNNGKQKKQVFPPSISDVLNVDQK